MGEKWIDIIASSGDQSSVIDLPFWTSRCALDAIGEIAFDYRFGALDDSENALGKAFSNLMLDTFGTMGGRDIFALNIMGYIPTWLREWIGDNIPSKKLLHAHTTAKLATEVARDLVAEKSKALMEGRGSRDIMSLLIRANASENQKVRLNEEEILGVMRVVILAGHETTANTLCWMLLEIARSPAIQTRLRREIREMEQIVQLRGDSQYTIADLDSMPYLNAVLKETLRYHPVAINTFRQTARDDILPLSNPITTLTGEVINELPVPKGMKIITSISSYNRKQDIFGPDAHLYNPDRWFNSGIKKETSVGVVGNLVSFSGGVRSCIGWKFAMAELQAFLFELVGNFEFETTPECQMIRREAAIIMTPTLESQVDKGAQLPLRVRVASREGEHF